MWFHEWPKASTIALDATVVTNNESDYRHVPGLTIENSALG